jgi:indole-3-glycerol phosphate synthase
MTKKTSKISYSQEDRLRNQGKMLDEIMRWKRQELPKRQRMMPVADLRALAVTLPDPLDFGAALQRPGLSLIAEVKQASPSRGLLCRDFDPIRLARTYVQGGAAAISVLTDSRYFQGRLEHLTEVAQISKGQGVAGDSSSADGRLSTDSGQPAGRSRVPVLRKDFIFDSYQVVESRVAGADALLLIVAVLGDGDLRRLLAETRAYGMEALVEVHDEADLERALAAGAHIIGINNRNLRTFTVDLNTTARLRPLIPQDRVVVSESGIKGVDDVRWLASMDVHALLVGESLVAAEPTERLGKVRALVAAGR